MKKDKSKYSIIVILIFLISCQYVISQEEDWIFNIIPAGGETLVNETNCTISWTSSNTISDYDIYLWNGATSSFTTIATDVSSSSYTWSINTSSLTDRYRIKVQLSDNSNTYAFSSGYFSIIALPEEFSDVGDPVINESPELKIFPNPAMNILNIELKNNIIDNIYIWSMSGKLMMSLNRINSQAYKASIEKMPNGEYFLECYSGDNKRFVRKLIINR